MMFTLAVIVFVICLNAVDKLQEPEIIAKHKKREEQSKMLADAFARAEAKLARKPE